MQRVFLLSPAHCGGRRAKIVMSERATFPLAERLRTKGASIGDVVRVTYILPDAGDFPECWPVLRKWFGGVRPAATMISAGLADPRMRIEIEVTALKRSS